MKYKPKNWMPFEEARAFVHALNLKNNMDWIGYTDSGDLPHNIPKSPRIIYKDKGWKGFGDWLGTGAIQTQKREYLSFIEAREFARSLKLKCGREWVMYCKSELKPNNIPASPAHYYDKEWLGINDWLGNKIKTDYLPIEEAKIFVQKQKLISKAEWLLWCKSGEKPINVPTYPEIYYKNKGWNGWGDWLGSS